MNRLRSPILVSLVATAVAGVSFGQSLPPLLHLYEFATDARDSIGTSHGTLIGGASVVDGALQTDGASGYVQFPDKIIPTSGSFTVALWFNESSIVAQTGYFELISQGCSGCPGFYIGHEIPNRWRNFHDYHQPILLNSFLPPPDVWHHVAVTVDRDHAVSRLWVNGVGAGTLPPAPMTTAGSSTRLGRQFAPFDEFFGGRIDDVRVFGGVLSENAIASLSQSYPPPPVDCDGNGIVDYGEILDGTLADTNANGVPDCCDAGVSCDPCPGDLNASGTVDAEDLACILFAWDTDGGKTPQADIDRDGTVNANDLSVVLGGWGNCP